VTPARFKSITGKYRRLRIAVVGDFCLDRYFEIDPAKSETSIETSLPVHNVVRVRCQPGGAGTIVNNLLALGVGTIYAIGFAGRDGEGYELRRALRRVNLDHFVFTKERTTFTYSKPLLMHAGKPPEELSRLDIKNWTPTPTKVQDQIAKAVAAVKADAMILLDQVDIPDTGVVTRRVLEEAEKRSRKTFILADSRRGLRDFPKVCFKMNRAELRALTGTDVPDDQLGKAAATLARKNRQPVFVTLAEQGILGASRKGDIERQPCLPVRGPIDIVGAGDAVTANLTASLAAGASLKEAVTLANAAASIVIHQLGTTGTASAPQIETLLF
jgi:rfaE bifunctional protein kinase chain/domain